MSLSSLLKALKFDKALKSIPKSLPPKEAALLLQQCSTYKLPLVPHIALEISKVASNTTNKPFLLQQNGFFMLRAMQHCESLKTLAELKRFWDTKLENANLLSLYYTTFIQTYINRKEYEKALEIYLRAHIELRTDVQLPFTNLVTLLIEFGDADGLNQLLTTTRHNVFGVIWSRCLATALSTSHYELTKTIYDKYLMKNIPESHTTHEDILFDSTDPFEDKEFSESYIYSILHILASNGDINRSLTLIESFYIHRMLAGQKGLTKELSIMIIKTYCLAHSHISSEDLKDTEDQSVKRVLDILGRMSEDISYKDISQFMSEKFVHYKVYDEKIERAPKASSPLEYHLPVGNALANLDTLANFTAKHLNYITEKQFSAKSASLFINCVLNHVAIYQNFSGALTVLSQVKKVDPQFEWLDNDSLDILSYSLGIAGSKQCAVYFFGLLRKKAPVSHIQYRGLINACLRGNFKPHLKYFLYWYIKDHGEIDGRVKEELKEIPTAFLDTELEGLIHNNIEAISEPQEPQWSEEQLPGFNKVYVVQNDKQNMEVLKRLWN